MNMRYVGYGEQRLFPQYSLTGLNIICFAKNPNVTDVFGCQLWEQIFRVLRRDKHNVIYIAANPMGERFHCLAPVEDVTTRK